MASVKNPVCPGSQQRMSRREFVRMVGGATLAAGVLPMAVAPRPAVAASSLLGVTETTVSRFYDTLTQGQRQVICLPFEHELRHKISNHWAVTEPTIGEFFNLEQQTLIDEIFRSVSSDDGYERFQKQMSDDAGGIGNYHVALFGQPGSGQFQFEMTGQHLTIRADGNHEDKAAFGGPIVYGHGAGDSQPGLPGNVFYHQTQRVNEVFAALDGKQRDKALLTTPPFEGEVPVQGPSGRFPGIAVGDLASDQRDLVEEVSKVILAPYREEHVDEALAVMKAGGGLDRLHMAFYKSNDLGYDLEWDIWRIEGPTFVWHFRGAPHVHAYVNIAGKA